METSLLKSIRNSGWSPREIGGPAHPGRAMGIDVRVEHGLTRQPGMQVPVLVMIGPSRQPPDEPYLFTIEESAILVAKIRAGQIGRGEIVLGGSFGPEG